MIRIKMLLRLLAFLLPVAAIQTAQATAPRDTITVNATPVPLNIENPTETRVGRLTYIGGLALRSLAPGFGGYSGLHISPDGASLLAVSDMGYWLSADLVYRGDGAPKSVRNARLIRMLGPDGAPVTGKRDADAEALAVSSQWLYVSFERNHRIWRYPRAADLAVARPEAVPPPEGLNRARNNGGLEVLTLLADGRLLAVTENMTDAEGRITGWLQTKNGFERLSVVQRPPFALTDATLLPGGNVLLLERRYSRGTGLGIRLREIPGADIKPGAMLGGTEVAEFGIAHTIDNFEGLSARRTDQGDTLIYVMSDNNFSIAQRTLLLVFRLDQ